MNTPTLLSQVAWNVVNERVLREQRNREVYVPPISLFRWWARRPHALIGALMDAAANPGSSFLVSDPFSGGGTVAMEAARRGLGLYAQDLHPWAVAGLATVLDGVDPEELEAAVAEVLKKTTARCDGLYATYCPDHGPESLLAHVFWVRAKACPACAEVTFLFPYSLVSLASRQHDEEDAFLGCPACGLVSKHGLATVRPRCSCCRRVLPAPDTPLIANRRVTCQNRSCRTSFAAFDGSHPQWTAVLVQRVCGSETVQHAHLDIPSRRELSAEASVVAPAALAEEIDDGTETALLRRAGFSRWADVFPARQLRTMVECAGAIDELQTSDTIRARLRLALCGAAEMAGYLSRWDRYYPKAFEATANHRFPALGFACETNLLAPRGRGTLHRRFAQSVTAAQWAERHIATSGVRVADAGDRRRAVRSGALLVRGSSERQLPPDKSVDLVLTDPPYFDDVQYAELASLFLTMARTTQLIPNSVSVDLRSEAVANPVRGAGVNEYRDLLSRIFTEARRTLKRGGRLVLTYHNTDIQAWWALGDALREASLDICALAVAEAENAMDHSKRGRNSFTCDLVIECLRAATPPRCIEVVTDPRTPEAKELIAAGRAISKARGADMSAFVELYRTERGPLVNGRIRIPEPEDK